MSSRLAAYDPQLEIFEGEKAPQAKRRDEPIDEIREMEFATELLELRNEESLQHFVARIVRDVARAMKRSGYSTAAAALQGPLIALLLRAMRGSRPTERLGEARVRSSLGDRLADINDHKLGLELEGLSDEDRQFATARQLVRFVADAAERALCTLLADPDAAARAALFASARRYAPGLLAGHLQRHPLGLPRGPRSPTPATGAHSVPAHDVFS
jgi:hypothetical protein